MLPCSSCIILILVLSPLQNSNDFNLSFICVCPECLLMMTAGLSSPGRKKTKDMGCLESGVVHVVEEETHILKG
jgi:hypothetical protein